MKDSNSVSVNLTDFFEPSPIEAHYTPSFEALHAAIKANLGDRPKALAAVSEVAECLPRLIGTRLAEPAKFKLLLEIQQDIAEFAVRQLPLSLAWRKSLHHLKKQHYKLLAEAYELDEAVDSALSAPAEFIRKSELAQLLSPEMAQLFATGRPLMADLMMKNAQAFFTSHIVPAK